MSIKSIQWFVCMASQQRSQRGCWCSGGEILEGKVCQMTPIVRFSLWTLCQRDMDQEAIKRQNILTVANVGDNNRHQWRRNYSSGSDKYGQLLSMWFFFELTVGLPWEDNIQQVYEIKYVSSWRHAVWIWDGKLLAIHMRLDAVVSLQQPSRSDWLRDFFLFFIFYLFFFF